MRPGDRVSFEVAENLTYRNQVVVPVGSPAFGEVIRSERNGMLGKSGQIEIRLLYAETPYGPVRLGGGTGAKGKDATVWSVAGAIFVAWPFIFVHGTSGYVRAGSMVPGHLEEPLTFNAVSSISQSAPAEPVGPDPVWRFPAQSKRAATGYSGPVVASRLLSIGSVAKVSDPIRRRRGAPPAVTIRCPLNTRCGAAPRARS